MRERKHGGEDGEGSARCSIEQAQLSEREYHKQPTYKSNPRTCYLHVKIAVL
jgi:hypothetical protein